MLDLVKIEAGKVVNQWHTDHHPEQGLMDVTGRPDGPRYMGRSYTEPTDIFSAPLPPPPKTRRQLLADKTTWIPTDRDESLRILLDPRKGI